MIVCFDVHYEQETANAAAIVFEDWSSETVVQQCTATCPNVGSYQPGQFYQRELKPLQKVLAQVPSAVDVYLIDAYCHLDSERSPGLGAYFHDLLPQGSVVVGIAKNRFRDTTHAIEVCRGESNRPLFVTAIGIEYDCAASLVQSMAGRHRIPSLLKAVDRLCRDSF